MDTFQKNTIINGVKLAGEGIREYIGKINRDSMSKVTSFDYGIPADKKAEKIIFDAIGKSGLDAKIISEEAGFIGNENAEYTIYVDPLDGSINFSRGIPVFCIGLGVYKGKEPVLGVVYDVSFNELFVAEIGMGTTVNGKKIVPSFLEANTLVNFEWFGAPIYESVASKLKAQKIRARTAGSGVLALTYGSIGRGDGTVLIDNKPWDIAPGMVFAVENGYKIKQFSGEDVDLSIHSQNIVAAPPELFDKLFSAVSE